MGFFELLLLGVGLSMDAFAVSVCKGLSMKKATLREGAICGVWFGGFQALMPLIGFFLGTLFAGVIQAFDHWVAFGLLAIIGVNMLKEAFSTECDCEEQNADLSVKTMFVMAIATSIDAMAAGLTISEYNASQAILYAAIIAAVTFVICLAGVVIGRKFGTKLAGKASVLGGVILIAIGLEIFITGIL